MRKRKSSFDSVDFCCDLPQNSTTPAQESFFQNLALIETNSFDFINTNLYGETNSVKITDKNAPPPASPPTSPKADKKQKTKPALNPDLIFPLDVKEKEQLKLFKALI